MKRFIFWIALLLLWSLGANAFAANNPVVQIVWYDAVWWRYPNMLWWGSASIISNNGLILTNNHVVDNGRGGTLAWFSICITTTDTQRPKCHYTASLIARDIRRDISLLRIDPLDIFGNTVNFADMKAIDLNYEYVPQAGDVVTAIWYPWVWSNTITKTQWVVAGTQPYNDVSYIKTDALIAGGNSWWPLVIDNKVIGVNTFGIGGGFDASLWYALSISEAQAFIQENMNKSGTPVSPTLWFARYLRNLEQINIDTKISDDFITMNFDTSYKVTHYIPNLQLRWEISNPDIYHVQEFNIQRIKLPIFKDKKEQDYFLKNQMQLYGSWWGNEKLRIIRIGWLDFYEPVYVTDPSGGEGYWYKRYFMVTGDAMIMVTLYAPLWNENTQTQVKANIESFLANISFGQINQLPKQVFSLYDPLINLPYDSGSLVDLFGQIDWWFNDYYGWRSSYTQYLWNLYELIGLQVESNTLFDGKGKTTQQLLDSAIADIYGVVIDTKWIVNYYGNEWYMFCVEDAWTTTDPQWRNHKMTSCMMRIVVGEEHEHIITVMMTASKANLTSIKSKFWLFADQILKPLWDAELGVQIDDKLVNAATNLHQFNDIADQDMTLQKLLNKLVWRWILQSKDSFNGDYPLLWQDYIKLYLKMVYNKNLTDVWSGSVSYGDLVSKLPYNPVWFVPVYQVHYDDSFALMLKIKLAGVDYHDFSEYGLYRFNHLKDSLFKDQWNQIQEWEYSVYGDRSIDLFEAFGSIEDRHSDYRTIYNPVTQVLSKNLTYSKDPINLNHGTSITALSQWKEELKCYSDKVSLLSNTCLQLWRTQVEQYVSYPVVTKWDAVSYLMYQMDIGLFDALWAIKKDTQIDTGK